MLLDLTQIRQPETELVRRYQPSQFEGHEAARGGLFRLVAPVELHATIHQDKVRFRLVGTVSTVLELACSRCVEPFALPLHAAFDLRYLPHAEIGSPEREGRPGRLIAGWPQTLTQPVYTAWPRGPTS